MNLKGEKFKKPNQFYSSPHANSFSFKLSQFPLSNSKPLLKRLMEDYAMSYGEPITWRYNVSTERRIQSRFNLEEMETMAGTGSI